MPMLERRCDALTALSLWHLATQPRATHSGGGELVGVDAVMKAAEATATAATAAEAAEEARATVEAAMEAAEATATVV